MDGGVVTILTDFGVDDPYVGIMKGVMLNINPTIRLIDLTHHIPPQNVRAGAFIMAAAYSFFPEKTVHLAIVDPGVGTERRLIAARSKKYFFVGPDNGIFSLVWNHEKPEEIVSLDNPEYWLENISSTFHGRDIMAPVAAYISKGVELSKFGESYTPVGKLPWSPVIIEHGKIRGEIIYIDRFGNLVTSIRVQDIPEDNFPDKVVIRIGKWIIRGISRTYGDASPGSLIALIGSYGYLEIAVTGGSAQEKTGLSWDEPVEVSLL